MNRTVLGVLIAGGILLAATIWLTFPLATKSAGDPSKFRFMHCPECNRESAFSPTGFEKPCLYCEKPLVGTVESIQVTGTRSPLRRMIAYLLAESVGIMAVVVYLLYHPPPPPELDFYYAFCPNGKCKRKMRYPANRAGAQAQCPLCKTTFVNPTLEEQAALE